MELSSLSDRGELARAGAIAFEAVLVESVEDLMVGEHARARLVVDKAFVDGAEHRGEVDVVAPVGEYHFQAFDLLLAVAEYAQAVTVGEQSGERFADKLEILVVDSLRRAAEVDRRAGLGVGLRG